MKKTRTMTITAMLAGMAFVLQMLGSFMGLKVAGFLEIEFSDLPAVIGALSLGPLCGVAVEFIKNLLHCFFTSTGYVGELANFLVNGVFVFTVGYIYKLNKNRRQAIIGLSLGTVIYTLAAALSNLYITLPLFMPGVPFGDKMNLVLTIITPFNLAKGIVISAITMLIYKKLSPIIKGR